MDAATIFSGVSALAAVATAGIAIYALSGTRADSREQTRPIVIAELVPAPLSTTAIDLRIANYGRSSALDVAVRFDPPMPTSDQLGRDGRLLPFIAARYARSIPLLAPRASMTNVFQAVSGDEEAPQGPVTATITYRSAENIRYSNKFVLDVNLIGWTTTSQPATSTEPSKRIANAVESLARQAHWRP
ncbi:hypothetical protein [Nocardioides sp.]|uniref:hypothetical protein n=1 Tax=Nocardioides sp. TaxID=35761 RepID=UPI002B50FF41|nr:hypothetical protein [Nocardioides sp.]HSX68522.1 hypothetical protein [Nocardioides sp.]